MKSIFVIEITHEEKDEVSTEGIQECLTNTFKIRHVKMYKRNDEHNKCEFVDTCRLNTNLATNQSKSWCYDLGSLDKSACYCIIRSRALKLLGFDE